MDDLVITRVSPFSPGDESAEVTVSNGKGELVAFCWPCSYNVGDRVANRLKAALYEYVRAAYLTDWPEEERFRLSQPRIERIGAFAYVGCGTCIDEARGLVEVNGFVLDFGEASWDGPVEFEITRLDLN